MSGTNPFRRKPPLQQSSPESTSQHQHHHQHHYQHQADARQTEAQVPPIDTDIPRTTKSKTVKSVRIISPHSTQSEAETYIIDSLEHAPKPVLHSPPPEPVFLVGQEGGTDPFQAEFETLSPGNEDDATLQNTRSNAGEGEYQTQPLSDPGKPSNPFKKSVLALEQARPNAAIAAAEGSPARTGVPANKPHYDVDDFKRLLLAGERQSPASIAPRAPNVNFGAPSIGDSSSATDSSSLSRQSLFEPTAGTLSESPRTSRDASPAEEERHRLASHTVLYERIKPSPPQHRHGKLVKATAPQTISLEDPALSLVVSDMKPKDAAQSAPLVVSNQKVKSLPPLPPVPRTKDASKTYEGSTITSPPEDVESNNLPVKPTPPPAPASRKSGHNRPISFSNLPSRQQPAFDRKLSDSPPTSASPPFDSVNAPPPPPPRRSATVRVNSSSSTLTLASTVSGSEQSRPLFQLPRSPTMPATKSTELSSPASGSPARSLPPLPPPRRRGSSQSSYTPSRFSSDYLGAVTERMRSDSGASSISHLAMTPIDPSQSKPDVLADLTALQREVDELRGKMKE